MIRSIRAYFIRRERLRKLRAEHSRTVAHRDALIRLGTGAALALALQQIDLQIAAVENDMRFLGAEPPPAPSSAAVSAGQNPIRWI